MSKIEFHAKTFKIGNSIALIIPSYFVKVHKINPGEKVVVSLNRIETEEEEK